VSAEQHSSLVGAKRDPVMSDRLAVVAGHTLLGTPFAADAPRVEVPTPFGSVSLRDAGSFVFCQRHGLDEYAAPHAIDHGANLTALKEAGCDRVLALGSAGSLRPEIPVGTFIAPHDFISLSVRATLSDGAAGHRVPGFDPEWRAVLVGAFAAVGLPVRDRGVYWQSEGPRFETPAEVRMIARDADLVGMTIASEAAIAAELGLRYAAVCNVDNLANGVEAGPLAIDDYESGKAANQERAQRALDRMLPALASPQASTPPAPAA
jgi:5'-methylthioinosine phosphorylase